jgi:hypothetical protein
MPSQKTSKKAAATKSSMLGVKLPAVMSTKPSSSTTALLKTIAKGVAYAMANDRSLTSAQAKGGFRPEVVTRVIARQSLHKGGFRFASNLTTRGIKSGYHEAAVVTDMTDILSRRIAASAMVSNMPTEPDGYWKTHSGVTIHEPNVASLMAAGDGARTDTARTILSGPNGVVTGHSGSGVDTTGQSGAHDLLRDQMMRVVKDSTLSSDAIAVVSAATAVYSMAPGVLASTAGNAAMLKDQAARTTWERDRNEAKRRVAAAFAPLPQQQKKYVINHMQKFSAVIGGGRHLEVERPSSPFREEDGLAGAAIKGGGYVTQTNTSTVPTLELPPSPDPRTVTLYATEPFRIPRR